VACAAALYGCAGDVDVKRESPDERRAERERMVAQQLAARDIDDPRVLAAMRAVPRHRFVPADVRGEAYGDHPLPIGSGQTISQPYVVAWMTQALELDAGERVLEIGTGSGYQAAVLAELTPHVYTIEIVPELGERASEVLEELDYENVETKIGDGYYGWPEAAPFDGIVVTAAASHIPPPLVEQLKVGGRMVIPVGGPFAAQQLMLVEKAEDGSVTTRQLLPVRFVPFTRADER
jgi:protein-L-isoaspartate(D-aspartate) O-methyltransferase